MWWSCYCAVQSAVSLSRIRRSSRIFFEDSFAGKSIRGFVCTPLLPAPLSVWWMNWGSVGKPKTILVHISYLPLHCNLHSHCHHHHHYHNQDHRSAYLISLKASSTNRCIVVCIFNHHHPCIIVVTSETKLYFVSWCECVRVCSHQQGGAALQSLSQTHS